MYFYGNARTALYFGLKKYKARSGTKILAPSVLCSSVLEPIAHLKMRVSNYNIDSEFALDVDSIAQQIRTSKPDFFLYVNYFCSGDIPEEIVDICRELDVICIVDNSHCFYENYNTLHHVKYGFVIYSIRKIFPLHSGGMLVDNEKVQNQDHSNNSFINVDNYVKYILKLGFRSLINRLKLFSSEIYPNELIEIKSFQLSYIDKVSMDKFYKINIRKVSLSRNSYWKEWYVVFSNFENGFKIIPKIDDLSRIPWAFVLHNKAIEAQKELLRVLLGAGVTAFIWPDNKISSSYLCIELTAPPKEPLKKKLLKLKNAFNQQNL